jgi:hypothetical protein
MDGGPFWPAFLHPRAAAGWLMTGWQELVYVDRYWHCVAAELEAGLIDDAGNPMPEHGFDEGSAAYRDWCRRHPESKPALDPS